MEIKLHQYLINVASVRWATAEPLGDFRRVEVVTATRQSTTQDTGCFRYTSKPPSVMAFLAAIKYLARVREATDLMLTLRLILEARPTVSSSIWQPHIVGLHESPADSPECLTSSMI